MFERIAALTWFHPKKVLAAIAAFMVVGGVLGSKVEEHLKAAGFDDPESESVQARELLRADLGYDPDPGIVVLVTSPDGGKLDLGDPKIRAEVRRLSARMGEARFVAKVNSPIGALDRTLAALPGGRKAPVPDAVIERFRAQHPQVARDGRSLIINGHLDTDDPEEEGGIAAEDAQRLMQSDVVELGFAGFAVGFNEVADQARDDLNRAEMIAFPILAVLLLIVFRGVVAAAVPLVIGVASILGTFLVLRVMAEFVGTSLFALNIATALSLGLAVDYALLMISRYREELEEQGPTREAHFRMVSTAGRTVVFSGVTVAAAMVALTLFPQRFLYSVGAAGATVGLLASTIALLGVPSVLALIGPRINALSVRRRSPVSEQAGGWYRLAKGVMRRPVLVAVASGAVMLGAGFPALSALLTGPSAEALPPSKPAFAVYRSIEATYPADATIPISVAVTGEASGPRLEKLRAEINRLDGVEGSRPFVRAPSGIAFTNFGLAQPAPDPKSQDVVRAIRDRISQHSPELVVSGNTAGFIDQKKSLIEHLPLVAGLMVVLTLILLFMLTGSVILPLKTLVMNALTLTAVLGILVLAFQEGLLSGPLDYPGPDAIELLTIALIFAITFGLATDYAVLVMARIKEQHDLGRPNKEAVAIGIGRTGRVISAAAMLLAVVFLAFASSDIFFMKQAAVGQAAGVLLDATIVRALLVPALMALFGELNWWAPAPLARFQARFGFREG